MRSGRRHHLEGPGIDEIAHQDAGLVAKDGVGGIAATAHPRVIDHIVMQQGGGVDELDEGRGLPISGRPREACLGGSLGRQQDQASGRRRLPPPATICSATWPTRATWLDRRVRMISSTASRSVATSARISGRPMDSPAIPLQGRVRMVAASDCLAGGNRLEPGLTGAGPAIRMRGLSQGPYASWSSPRCTP